MWWLHQSVTVAGDSGRRLSRTPCLLVRLSRARRLLQFCRGRKKKKTEDFSSPSKLIQNMCMAYLVGEVVPLFPGGRWLDQSILPQQFRSGLSGCE